MNEQDVSPNFKPNSKDTMIIQELLRYEETPRAITRFSELQNHLTNYSYWFIIGTLWVSYSGWSDLQLWKQLFRSSRPKRASSLMKPSEFRTFCDLPDKITVYRAHRTNERDWISYTLDFDTAVRFARERSVGEIVAYEIRKKDALSLFLRRGEREILMLEPTKARRIEAIPVNGGDRIEHDLG